MNLTKSTLSLLLVLFSLSGWAQGFLGMGAAQASVLGDNASVAQMASTCNEVGSLASFAGIGGANLPSSRVGHISRRSGADWNVSPSSATGTSYVVSPLGKQPSHRGGYSGAGYTTTSFFGGRAHTSFGHATTTYDVTPSSAAAISRAPKNPPIGGIEYEVEPVGDAILPLLLCVLAFAAYRRVRRRRATDLV